MARTKCSKCGKAAHVKLNDKYYCKSCRSYSIPTIAPLTIGNDYVKPLTVDDSRIIPLTVGEKKSWWEKLITGDYHYIDYGAF